MRIIDYFRDDLILLDIDAKDKSDAIHKVVNAMSTVGILKDTKSFLKEVNDRESLGSTAIGDGVAIPHARTNHVKEIIVTFARLTNSVDFGAEDDKPVQIIFLMGTPIQSVSEYLKVLAELSKKLRNSKIREALLAATNASQVRKVFQNQLN